MSEQPVPEILPLFPLPNLVFFTGTLLPLHVFEKRYVQLVHDVRAGDSWVAVPLLKPGYHRDYAGAPAYYPVAGAGRVIRMQEQPDHTLSVEIQGLVRVSLAEIASDRLYRYAAATVLEERGDWLVHPEADRVLTDLVEEAASVDLLTAKEAAGGLPRTRGGRAAMINGLASKVLVDTGERQALLEAPGYRDRVALIRGHLRVMIETAKALRRFPRPEHPEYN